MTRIKALWIRYTITLSGTPSLDYRYFPISEGGDDIGHLQGAWGVPRYDEARLERARSGQEDARDETERRLLERCSTFLDLLSQRLPAVTYEIDRERLSYAFKVESLEHTIGDPSMTVSYKHQFEPSRKEQVAVDNLTLGQQRLLSSINASVRRLAWEHLKQRLGAPARRSGPQVFMSYRKGHETFAQRFAERLGQEGLVPWFDKWDVLAGDSIPGKIEEAFRDSDAFLPILTADYQAGQWVVEEMRTAIAKRIEQGYRIVPIRLEECEPPELIRQLRYVDFSDQEPQTFEQKIAEVVDAVYGLQQNPFR